MDREEALQLIKDAAVAEFEGCDFYEEGILALKKHIITTATNLSEIAILCQNSAWDIAMFIEMILKCFGFNAEDMSSKWLNEHCYGWDT